MFAEISSVVESVKIISNILEASKDLRDFNELASAVSKVNAQLLNATAVALASQEKQALLSSRVAELENQLREIENWESEKKRYKLHTFATGTFAYALQEGMEQGEPMHYLCANCMNKKQKCTLQAGNNSFLECHNCKNLIQISSQSSFHRVTR